MQVDRHHAQVTQAHRPILLALFAAVLLAGCSDSAVPVYTTQFAAFNTAVDLSIIGVQQERAAAVANEIERDFRFFDQALCGQGSTRMLSLNRRLASGEPFAAPPSLIPLIARTQTLSEESNGLFNPALGRLTRLWDLDVATPSANPPPSDAAIEAVLAQQPRPSDIQLDGIELKSNNPAVQLDFDPVAVAYATDRAVDALRAQGVRSAMINAGGDVRAIGGRSGRPWRVAVPRASGSGVIGIIDISGDASLFTASMQRRNFIYGGTLYHAVIDPRSGRPADGAVSASVLYQGDALTAAAAAQALMIAGAEQWPSIAARMGIEYALVIDAQNRLHLTPAMAQILNLLDTNAERIITDPLEVEPPLTD